MKISLIMATLGRSAEVKNLLESLKKQNYRKFQLIIVDQNNDDRVSKLIPSYSPFFEIKYLRSQIKGISFNRNLGLKYVSGNIIALTDDDGEYREDTLENIAKLFSNNSKYDIISIGIEDKITKKNLIHLPSIDIEYNFSNIFKVALSFTLFIKYKKLSDLIFDEKLGVGATFPSGEETDMLLNLLHSGYKGKYVYEKNLKVYHPYKENTLERASNYSLGAGALLKKELFYRKNIKIIPVVIEELLVPALGIIKHFKNPDARNIRYAILKGKITGFFKYNL